MENKIHIAYGFHVNCYHSYRGDTNDNLGFGSDIRIIRKILDTLTKFNENGIAVKGTWDCENFFSLERILPEYAPDIIEKMRVRTEKYGDEQIIMGYSNGALGAMNTEELEASVRLAVTNEQGSGLKDLFGRCEMIVRPQEVMFSPSQVSVYNKLGVKALCLYYSCVPFDAFRTIVKKLPDKIAFNPVNYVYKGEKLTVIPTYSNSDVCDAGCLRAWVKELHKKQKSGEINSDLLIFINMDADAIFWESLNLPVKIANTDGIRGLVEEVCDLPYVVFDTPGNYLKNHKPKGTIEFTQDTADGNFTGYASWAEKPYNRKIWTAIERARAMAKINSDSDEKSASFRERVLLLSTTHFGLATPVLNLERERKADHLAERILTAEITELPKTEKLTVYNISGSRLQCVQLRLKNPIEKISTLRLSGDGLKDWAIVSTDSQNETVFVLMQFSRLKKQYTVEVQTGEPNEKPMKVLFSTEDLTLRLNTNGRIDRLMYRGKTIGKNNFLRSFVTYGNRDYMFEQTGCEPLDTAGSAEGIRLYGEIHLPGELHPGSFLYDFFTVPFSTGMFVRVTVNYPYTAETDSISTENSALGRYSDMKWKQAVPFEVTPLLNGDISVVKRNFMGDVSSFRTQSFPECDSKNSHLDSFNHQLTGGFVGLTDGETGFAVANSRQVLNSMAHCPMRLDEDKTVHMNPFGTYYGKQRHHFSRAKDQILATYTLITPQGKSIAPAYNGNSETAVLGLFGFSGNQPDEKKLKEINAFADGAVVSAGKDSLLQPFYGENVKIKKPLSDGVNEKQLKSPILTGIKGNLCAYVIKGTRAITHIVVNQIKSRF